MLMLIIVVKWHLNSMPFVNDNTEFLIDIVQCNTSLESLPLKYGDKHE